MAIDYGNKRLTVGAHYGFGDWLVQRVTAGVMLVFTLILILHVLLIPGEVNSQSWAAVFSGWWMKGLTFAACLSLAYHAWVGVRDIWMDYVKPLGLRLGLHVLTVVWLLACLAWMLQILWRL